jgi:sugar phosphate isomerase/epimerase
LKKIKRLLNFSTHGGDLRIFSDDWEAARRFLTRWGFDGFELYPVGDYPWERIPRDLIESLHLRFFVILRQGWEQQPTELQRVFGDRTGAARFYGGHDTRTAIRESYRRQFELARELGCETVVFHPAHCELEYIYDWDFPWDWRQTLDLCAEVLNESLAGSSWRGTLLLENLWWPGSFRLARPQLEYTYLKERLEHQDIGIVLDTGHLLNRDGGFTDERSAITWLLEEIAAWPEALRREIRALHLTASLSRDYIRASRHRSAAATGNFAQRLNAARRHVKQIDRHDPFTDPAIGRLFELLEPRQVVFEFSFRDRAEWEAKIGLQKRSCKEHLW